MDEARERLTEAMEARLLELRMKWADVSRKAQMDTSNLRRIRRGQISITRDAAYGLEEAFEWPHGYIAALLAEPGPPVPLTPLQREALAELNELMADKVPYDQAVERVVENTRAALERSRRMDQSGRDTG